MQLEDYIVLENFCVSIFASNKLEAARCGEESQCCFEGLFVHIAKLSVITVAILHWGNATF